MGPEKDRSKVLAAVMAAVNAYLEEESARMSERLQRPVPVVNIWPILGREEIMRMRTLWQRRIT